MIQSLGLRRPLLTNLDDTFWWHGAVSDEKYRLSTPTVHKLTKHQFEEQGLLLFNHACVVVPHVAKQFQALFDGHGKHVHHGKQVGAQAEGRNRVAGKGPEAADIRDEVAGLQLLLGTVCGAGIASYTRYPSLCQLLSVVRERPFAERTLPPKGGHWLPGSEGVPMGCMEQDTQFFGGKCVCSVLRLCVRLLRPSVGLFEACIEHLFRDCGWLTPGPERFLPRDLAGPSIEATDGKVFRRSLLAGIVHNRLGILESPAFLDKLVGVKLAAFWREDAPTRGGLFALGDWKATGASSRGHRIDLRCGVY